MVKLVGMKTAFKLLAIILQSSLFFVGFVQNAFAQAPAVCTVTSIPQSYVAPDGRKIILFSTNGNFSHLPQVDQDRIRSGQIALIGPSDTISISVQTSYNTATLDSFMAGQTPTLTFTGDGYSKSFSGANLLRSGNTFSIQFSAGDVAQFKGKTLNATLSTQSWTICRQEDLSRILSLLDIESPEFESQEPTCSAVVFSPALANISATTTSITANFPSNGFNSNDGRWYYLQYLGTNANGQEIREQSTSCTPATNCAPSLTVTDVFNKSYNGASFRLIRQTSNGGVEVACQFASFRIDPQTGNPVEGPGADTENPAFALCLQADNTGPQGQTDRDKCLRCYGSGGGGAEPGQEGLVSDSAAPTSLWTAFGCVQTSPTGMIQSFLRIILGLAGGIVLLVILYGAFLLTTSSGDPKRVQEGQEMITSAVMGILFIIFSVIILQFIGVKLLQIPGFGT